MNNRKYQWFHKMVFKNGVKAVVARKQTKGRDELIKVRHM